MNHLVSLFLSVLFLAGITNKHHATANTLDSYNTQEAASFNGHVKTYSIGGLIEVTSSSAEHFYSLLVVLEDGSLRDILFSLAESKDIKPYQYLERTCTFDVEILTSRPRVYPADFWQSALHFYRLSDGADSIACK